MQPFIIMLIIILLNFYWHADIELKEKILHVFDLLPNSTFRPEKLKNFYGDCIIIFTNTATNTLPFNDFCSLSVHHETIVAKVAVNCVYFCMK